MSALPRSIAALVLLIISELSSTEASPIPSGPQSLNEGYLNPLLSKRDKSSGSSGKKDISNKKVVYLSVGLVVGVFVCLGIFFTWQIIEFRKEQKRQKGYGEIGSGSGLQDGASTQYIGSLDAGSSGGSCGDISGGGGSGGGLSSFGGGGAGGGGGGGDFSF